MYNISWLLNHPQALGRQCLGDRHLKATWANKTGSTLHGQPLSGSTRLEQIYVRLKPGYSQVKLADHHVPIKPVTGTIPRFQKYHLHRLVTSDALQRTQNGIILRKEDWKQSKVDLTILPLEIPTSCPQFQLSSRCHIACLHKVWCQWPFLRKR